MSSFIEELWRGFVEETAEHLDAIDHLLPQLSRHDSDSKALIAALFRAFHSLKGLAGATSMRGMEALAHEAENLLGLLRDGTASLTEELIDALDGASEELHELRRAAALERRDHTPASELIERLHALAAGTTQSTRQSTPPSTHHAEQSGAPPQASEEAIADAGDEMLGLYAELLSSRIAELAQGLVATNSGALEEVLEALVHASQVVELEPLAGIFAEWIKLIKVQSWPLPAESLGAVRLHVDALAEKCALVTELTGQAVDLTPLYSVLPEGESNPSSDVFGAVYWLADALVTGDAQMVRSTAVEVERSIGLARRALDARGAGALCSLLQDLCGRLASGSAKGSGALAACVQRIGAALNAPEFPMVVAERLLAELSAIAGLHPGSDESTREASLPQHPIVESMPLQVRDMVADALRQGFEMFALTVYLEESPELAQPLMSWMTESGRIATSVSRIRGDQSWFEFVLLSQISGEVLRSELMGLDPEFRCLRRFEQISGEQAGVILLEEGRGTGAQRKAARAVTQRPDSVFRISGEIVDRVFDQIAEVSTLSSSLGLAIAGLGRISEAGSIHGRLQESFTQLDAALQRLHRDALQMRVVSIDSVFSRLPRVVRGLAKELGKKVELRMEGGDVRIDKSIVDRLTDPLIHMVRNSIDHGIEPPIARQEYGKPECAQLNITASQEGPEVVIVVSDDGRGIDTDSVLRRAIERGLVAADQARVLSLEQIYAFIFMPGFSTAAVITETSGRGVGMDVVLNTVRELGGSIHTASERGRGTRFSIRLPLSAAMQGISRIEVGGEHFGISDRFVSRVGLVARDSLRTVGEARLVSLLGRALSYASLAEILWGSAEADATTERDPQPVIVLNWGEGEAALAVDRLLGRRTVFMRELHPMLAQVPFLSGTTVEGDGTVLMVLDGAALLARALEPMRRTVSAAQSVI